MKRKKDTPKPIHKTKEELLKDSLIVRKKIYELSKSYMFFSLANLNLFREEDEKEVLLKKFSRSQEIFSKKLEELIGFMEPLVEKGNPNIDLDHYWKLLQVWKYELECC